MRPSMLLVFLLLIGVGPALQKVQARESKVRTAIWPVTVQGFRHALKSGDGNELVGNGTQVSAGYGILMNEWYLYGTLDVIVGPFDNVRASQFNSDFFGTGLTLWSGYSAQTTNLRSEQGGYGFALGFSYADVSGRSIGDNRLEEGSVDEDFQLLDRYSLRVTWLSVIPTLFFTWLGEARPQGNRPELLKTRIEGFLLTIGLSMPLFSDYRARLQARLRLETTEDELSEEDRAVYTDPVRVETGKMDGYSILVGFSALLGV